VLSHKLDDPLSNASTLYLLGEVARLQGDTMHAMKLYIEFLALNQVVGDKAMIGFALHNLGNIVQAHGKLEKAALLFGAAQSLREDSTNTTSWSLTNHAECDRDITALRNRLDKEAFWLAWAKGQAMSGDDAITYVLSLQGD